MAKLNIMKSVSTVGGLTAGSVAASYVKNLIPVENAQIKAAAPILVGLFLVNRSGIMGHIGAGMIAEGGRSLASSFGIGEVQVLAGYDFANTTDINPLAGTGSEYMAEYCGNDN
jgi:hypothetical protein